MANNFNEEHRKWILKKYWKYEIAETVRTLWQEAFHTPPPSRQTIYRLRSKLDKTGSVNNAPKRGRPKTSTTEENMTLVALTFVYSPKKSTRRACAELSISRTSLRRLLHSIKFKPYRPRLVDGLLEDEPDRQLQFCEMMRDQFVGEQVVTSDKIICSDEACFKLSGYANRHNCVYWADENPNLTIETQLNRAGVAVWGALSSEGVIGLVFLMEV